MGQRLTLRDGEVRIISVTPVARGIARPTLVAVVMIAAVIFGAKHVHFVHQHEILFGLVLAGPFILVTLTRVWRWRSHKIHVTNDRIIIERGVLGHRRSTIELHDVAAIRIDQRVSERLTRRGVILLETVAGTIFVGKVRHPDALCRLIDAERLNIHDERVPFDTVFSFDDPDPFDPEAFPNQRQQHRRYE
ncbi:MAG TPA: PH domain-containing protein [Acidimicrobiales bacterium]